MAETWDHLEEWEEWDESSGVSFHVHALAGSLAGASEHCAMYPVDTVKTYAQAEGSTASAIRQVVETKGVLRLWRGVSTMFAACIPAHAAYFSIYEKSKVAFGADQDGHHPLAAGASGALATIAHDSIMTPMDVIKQRLQLGFYEGMSDCARSIIRTEGAGALFVSFPITLLMNIPYAAVVVSTNESLKKIFNPSNEYNLPVFFMSGAISGALAAALTNPLDVAKTRLQTQHVWLEHTGNPAESSSVSAKRVSQTQNFRSGITRSIAKAWQGGIFGGLQGNTGLFASLSSSRNFRHVGQPSFGVSVSPFYSRACKYKYSNRHPGMFGASNVKGTTTSTTLSGAGGVKPRELFTSTSVRSGVAFGPLKESKGAKTQKRGVANGADEMRRQARYKGMVDTLKRIYTEEGLMGFARGLRPRLMVHTPSVAISWTTYETAKSFLKDL